ncbi:MoaD/ThiS family protein [Salinicoccus sesuvii]|uniref:Molybdopterin synthase sulfur carrier subunit n=1 Tax=Salinicoccus sesuvii TaxID=868281 RepID=A0ABV7N8N2_9STAP
MEVMLFAGLKEMAGQGRILIDTPASLTAGDLKKRIYAQYPSLDGEVFQVACNEAFVKDEHNINEHDEVALIPPVSGG